MDPSSSHDDRTLAATMKRKHLEGFSLHALMEAVSLLGLAFGQILRKAREDEDPLKTLASKVEALSLLLKIAEEENEILRARMQRLPRRERPFYTPLLRFRILAVRKLMAYSMHETARRFCVSVQTIVRWEDEARAHPERETVGSLVKPEAPVRRFADVVRHLVQVMALAGFGGSEMVAKVLTRAGWRISKRSVGRIRKEPRVPAPDAEPTGEADNATTVRARHPLHVLMMDLTELPSLFRMLTPKLAVVKDMFSRMPLAAKLFESEPSAEELAALFSAAATKHGHPSHLVKDKGSQFTAKSFREHVATFGTKQRFGAVGRYGSIAVIERFWRSLKLILRARLQPAVAIEDCCRKVELALLYFAYCRPHRGLLGATPAEVFYGIRPAHLDAVSPPRGRPGDVADDAPFAIVHLDPEFQLPLLFSKTP